LHERGTNILFIRLQAIGDCIGVFPYLRSLRSAYPWYRISFMTQPEVADVARAMTFLENVHVVRSGHNRATRLMLALPAAFDAASHGYDWILDLQDSPISRVICRMSLRSSRATMEKFEHKHHAERFIDVVRYSGLDPDGCLRPALPEDAPLTLDDYRDPDIGLRALKRLGIEPDCELVVLNPGGAYPSRNWAVENYAEFAERFRESGHRNAEFLALGTENRLGKKARRLARAVAGFHNLVGRTTLLEAMAILQHADLVVSEDSGLLHMAWTAGRPTVGILGSSSSYWGKPLGRHTASLDSSNLPCAWCLKPECPLGHYRCLTQYTPATVLSEAARLMKR